MLINSYFNYSNIAVLPKENYMKVVDDLDGLIADALIELFNGVGQEFNGTFVRIWALKLVEQFKTGEATDPAFDGGL